jgi:hypothetical protein
MDTTIQAPAGERLAELQAAVTEAKERLREIEGERARMGRELARASAPLQAYYEELGAGEREADEELEAKLAADVREARSGATLRLNKAPTDPAKVTGGDWVDERVEAKLAGARRALEDREAKLSEFLRGNRELVAEWIAEAAEVRDACEARWEEVRIEFRRWQEVLGRWGRFNEVNGIAPSELPPHPLRGIEHDPSRGIALPAPASLLPEGGASE